MSVVNRLGVQVRGYQERTGLRYCTDEELRRARAVEMCRLKELGLPTKKIARKYRVSSRYVNMIIKDARDNGGLALAKSLS